MTKYLISFIALMYTGFAFAQVGIGTEHPTETLDVDGTVRIRDINNLPGDLIAAKDSIVVFNTDGVLKYVSSNMIVATADASAFPNNQTFISSTINPVPSDGNLQGDIFQNTTNNSWWYFDGTSWLEIVSDRSLAEILANGNSANGMNISDLSEPLAPKDAATKNYVDVNLDALQNVLNSHITADLDIDATNEIQDLSLSGNILSITNNSGATNIDLTPYLDNTDNQQIQTFSLSGNTLTLTLEDGGTQSVDLAGYVSTDDQNIAGSAFNSINDQLTIGIENGTGETLDLSSLNDTNAIAAVQTDVDLNEADADAAIAMIQLDVDQNESDADAAIATLQADVDQNEADNDTAIAMLQLDVDQNEADADTAIANVQTNLDAHIASDLDIDATNEIQDLSLSGNTLSVTNNAGATNIDLSPYLDNTDNQQIQTFSLSGNTLTLTLENGGTQTVDLASYVSTDDQNILGSTFNSTNDQLTIGIENGTGETLDLSSLNDSAAIAAVQSDVDQNEADANASIDNVQTNLDAHIAADLDIDATNEIQDLSLLGNILTITNNGTATDINLSQYLDNTDDQQIQTFALVGNTLTLTLEDGGTQSVDLAGYVSTDDQNILGSTFDSANNQLTIGIENGNSETLDLSSLNDTAAVAAVQADVDQNEADANASIAAVQADVDQNEADADAAIANVQTNLDTHIATDFDIDATNEIQDLNLTGNILSMTNNSGATNIDLSPYLDNTDNQQIQTFALSGNTLTLTLENGGTQTVDLAGYVSSDDQNILGSAFNSSNDQLTIGIENGTSETLDLSSLNDSAAIANVQADVDTNEADADAAIAAVQANVDSNASNTNAAIAAVQANVDQNEADADTAIANVQTNLDAHIATDLDVDATNEIQDISTNGTAGNLTLSSGSTLVMNVNDADADATNEIQTLSILGSDLSLSNGGGTIALPTSDGSETIVQGAGISAVTGSGTTLDPYVVTSTEVDGSITNEIQDISTDGTAGNLTLSSGSTLALNVNDADADATNEIQTISLTGNDISLSNGGGTIALPTSDGSETIVQGAGISVITGSGTTLDPYIVTSTEVDGSITNEIQDISTDGTAGNLTLSSGSTLALNVNDADADSTNEIQTLSILGSDLSLSNGGGTVALPTSDGSETIIQGAGISAITGSGTTLDPYIVTSTEVDGSITNEIQDISTDGTAGNLTLSSGSTLALNVNDADADATNEIQDISTDGSAGNLSLSSGSTLALNVNDADADATNEIQSLSIVGSDLSLSNGGGTVALPTSDGSETIVQGAGISAITGSGTTLDPYVVTSTEVDGSITNEIQDISTDGTAGNLTLSSGSTLALNVNDADADAANEIQTLSLTGSNLSLSNGGGTIALPTSDGSETVVQGAGISAITGSGTTLDPYIVTSTEIDGSVTNEIQDISTNGTAGNLTLSSGSTLALNVNDADADSTNEIQTISIVGSDLSLSNGGGTIALPTSDGSETILQGAGISAIAGSGTTLDPYVVTSTEVDGSITNEIQDISTDGTAGNLTLSSGSTLALNVNDADADATNEIQDISTDGSAGNLTLSSGSTLALNVNDADADANNEIQTLSILGNDLSLSNGGGTIALPTSDGSETIVQGAGISAITGSGTSIDPYIVTSTEVDGSITNEIQSLSILGNDLTLSNGGGTIALPTSDGSETIVQGAGISAITGSGTTLDPYLVTSTEVDGSITNEIQDISTNGTAGNLTLSSGSTLVLNVNDADADSTNEIQTLSIVGSDLSLSNGGGIIALPTSDGSETIVQGAGISAITGSGTSINPYVVTSTEIDGSVTNEIQTLSIVGSDLSLSNGGGTVALPTSDGSETIVQGAGISAISGSGTTLDPYIVTSTEIDGSITNEIQDISTDGSAGNLSLSSGSTLALNVNDADADSTNEIQTLSLTGSDISLSNGGGTIALPTSDGSETIVQGAGISAITGSGSALDPYIVTSTEVDGSITNEIQDISTDGTAGNLTLSSGSTLALNVNDADADANNEIQTLSIVGSDLSLSNGGGTIALPTSDGSETIVQGAGISAITGSGTTIDPYIVTSTEVDGSITNEIQDISTDGTAGNITLSSGSTLALNVNDADADATNEIQDISTDGSAGNLSLSSGSTLALNVNDADADATNEIQTLSIVGSDLSLSNGGGTVALPTSDGSETIVQGAGISVITGLGTSIDPYVVTSTEIDGSITNEIQDISTNGTAGNLTLSSGSTLALNVNDADSDSNNEIQDISTDGTSGNLTLSSGSTLALNVNDADADATNEIQTLSIVGSDISLSNGGGTVALPTSDGSETIVQGAGISAITGSGTSVDPYVVTSTEIDGSVTNEIQDISTDGTAGNLTLSSGSTLALNVNDADADANNEIQTLSIVGNDLSLSNGGGTIALPTSDGSETIVQGAGISAITGSGTTLDPYIVTSTEIDGSITNEIQDISTNGTAGNLTLSSGSTLALNVNDADADSTNEIQDISTDGSAGNLTLSSGSTLALNVNDADADATNEIQTLSIVGNDLSLSNGGGMVALPTSDGSETIVQGAGISAITGSGTTLDPYIVTSTEIDGSITNEIQDISTNGTAGNLTLSSGSTLALNVNDADADATNEIQTLSVSGSTVTLSGSGGSFNLDGDGWGVTGEDINNPIYRNGSATVGNKGVVGAAAMDPGTPSNKGLIGIYNPDGSRQGYIGWGTGNYLKYTTDTEGSHWFNNKVGINESTPTARLDVLGVTYESVIKARTSIDNVLSAYGNGKVGIGPGMSTPLATIDAAEVTRTGTHNNANARFYFTGNFGQIYNGAEFVHSNGTAGIGIGWNGLYSMGTNGNNSFIIRSQTDANIALQPNGGTLSYLASKVSFYPSNNGGLDLGLSTNRWKAVYAVNGTIQTSDARLKKNIKNSNYGLTDVMKLRPVIYDWKDDTGNDKVGFIAQELKEVIPNVVVGDENEGYLGVNYAELVPVLTKAIQDQQEIIERQDEINNSQQNEIEELKKAILEMQEKMKDL